MLATCREVQDSTATTFPPRGVRSSWLRTQEGPLRCRGGADGLQRHSGAASACHVLAGGTTFCVVPWHVLGTLVKPGLLTSSSSSRAPLLRGRMSLVHKPGCKAWQPWWHCGQDSRDTRTGAASSAGGLRKQSPAATSLPARLGSPLHFTPCPALPARGVGCTDPMVCH